MGTIRMNRPLFPNPHLAEAYAALHAVLLGLDMGLRKIILEGDALNVVKEINGDKEHWGRVGMIVTDVQKSLQRFESWKVVHTSRSTNQVAHCLVKNALNIEGELVELEEVPRCITSLL